MNKLNEDINKFGWHVCKVFGEGINTEFAYSVGLYQTFNHPEIIFIGLKLDLAHILINNIGEDIKTGKKFESGKLYDDILDNFQCAMVDVSTKHYNEYVGQAQNFYKGDGFPLFQCIYPTIKGIYPWEKNWPKDLQNIQPILGDINFI